MGIFDYDYEKLSQMSLAEQASYKRRIKIEKLHLQELQNRESQHKWQGYFDNLEHQRRQQELENLEDQRRRQELHGHDDLLFDDAVRLVFEFGKASTTLLQRRLRIGYGRATYLIDLMEKDGLIGASDGSSKPRELLKPPSYFSEVSHTNIEEFNGTAGNQLHGGEDSFRPLLRELLSKSRFRLAIGATVLAALVAFVVLLLAK